MKTNRPDASTVVRSILPAWLKPKRIKFKSRGHKIIKLLAASFLSVFAFIDPGLATVQTSADVPVRLIVGFPPGGSMDNVARLLAQYLARPMNRPVIIENKAGAGGRIAVGVMNRSSTDGNVAMFCPDILMTIYPLVFNRLGYESSDLTPVSNVVEFPMAFAVPGNSAATSFSEYVAWAKSHPSDVSFGHGAPGSPLHFLGLMIGKEISAPMLEVPYQGSAPVMSALMGSQVSSGLEIAGGMLEYHRSGKLRILAVSSPLRLPEAPGVPTLSELGYPNLTITAKAGVCLPRETPTNVVAEWNSAISKVVALPEFRRRLQSQGYTPLATTPQEMSRQWHEAKKFWEPVVRATGFKAD